MPFLPGRTICSTDLENEARQPFGDPIALLSLTAFWFALLTMLGYFADGDYDLSGAQPRDGRRQAPRKARPLGNIAAFDALWQCEGVRKRIYHRLSAVLGMIAMLGALIALPMTTQIALAMSGPMVAKSTAHEMPCHKPAKPCPNCPEKVCPDMGTCLVKCFQPLASPLAETTLPQSTVSLRVSPGLSQTTSGSLIPPLLRPPSV